MGRQDREIRDSPFANIGCGVRRSVSEMLDLLLTMTDARIEVRRDPARLRPSDVRVLQADSVKFWTLTGWEPKIPFERTMRDLLDWWRRVKAARGAE